MRTGSPGLFADCSKVTFVGLMSYNSLTLHVVFPRETFVLFKKLSERTKMHSSQSMKPRLKFKKLQLTLPINGLSLSAGRLTFTVDPKLPQTQLVSSARELRAVFRLPRATLRYSELMLYHRKESSSLGSWSKP